MRGKPFQPGNKYGCGRPPGSRNQVASVSHEILVEHAEILFKKCVHMALQENVTALRLCIERLEPILRQRVLRFKMPSLATMAGVDAASEAVIKGVARGRLTTEQGEAFTEMLEGRRKIIESAQFEPRLKAVEEAQQKPAATSHVGNSQSGLGDLKEQPLPEAAISSNDSQAPQAKTGEPEAPLQEFDSGLGPIADQNEHEKEPE
jgi:hypothetical protein